MNQAYREVCKNFCNRTAGYTVRYLEVRIRLLREYTTLGVFAGRERRCEAARNEAEKNGSCREMHADGGDS